MRKFSFLVLFILGFWSVSIAQKEHFSRGYTTKNYDTLGTYYKMVSWDVGQYEQFTYYVTDTITGKVLDFMNYRLLFPNNYDSMKADGYPMAVMLHGAGESGRSWSGHFVYDPTDPRYDNNGHNLLWGGKPHLDAAYRDPSDPRAFDGFVLFGQVMNNGNWEGGWDNGVLSPRNAKAVKIIENIIDSFNVNANKIYVHGLSNGAKGVWDIVAKRPDLFAAYLPMSGVGRDIVAQTTILTTMPLWIFQGGLDRNPLPNASEDWVNAIIAKGGRPRRYLYPDLGHGTWNRAYAEPDFFSWMLDKDKRNIYVFGGNGETELCAGGQLTLGFSDGFLAYQWMKDGIDIPGATSTRLDVNEVGTYNVKYQRRNGSDSLSWDMSFDLNITPKLESTYKPPMIVQGSLALPTPYSNELKLVGPNGYSSYTWYQDGVILTSSSNNEYVIVPAYSKGNDSTLAGKYSLSVTEPSGCESLVSDSVIVSYGNGPTAPIAPTNVLATTVSASKIDVTWQDNSNNEDYFEVWRASGFGVAFSGWSMITILDANQTSFHDSGLLPETEYGYFIRATNFDGANESTITNNARTFTLPDLIAPSAPGNLVATGIGADTIGIAWDFATDNIAISRYNVYLNGDSVGSTTSAEFIFTNLQPLTSYNISVRAIDYSENKSSFSAGLWLITNEADPGLVYNIYNGTWSALPNFSSLTPVSSGVIATFDINERNNTDNFGFTFDGYINITTPGTYTFSTSSDDGSKLYIEGVEVVNNDGLHGIVTVSGNYTFPNSGKYAIRVTFFENGGGEDLLVQYQGADTGNSTIEIPDSVLFQNAPPVISVYYSKSTGNLELLSTWGDNLDGSGNTPSNFSNDYQHFVVANRLTSTLSTSWTVGGLGSKVIVANGETLSLNAQLTGMVELDDSAILNMNNSLVPEIGYCSATSIANINVNSIVPRGNYGNLNIGGIQATFTNNSTFVKGNLSANNLSILKGAVNNESVLSINGDITFSSSLSSMLSSEYFTLNFIGSGTHILSIPAENVGFYEIKGDFGATIAFENNTVNPTSLTLGTGTGGGLTLESTSSLILDNVSLNIVGEGTINPGFESGVVALNNADITITSGTTLNSNLFIDATNNLANNLVVDLTGGGSLTLYNGLNISNRVKIYNGVLDTNNSLTLQGTNSKTAYIDIIENNGTIIGNMTMQRHIRQGRLWRYVSSPFSGATIADWQKSVPITGNFTGASIITGMTSGPSLYYYDEATGLGDAGWVAYPPASSDNTAPILPGVGYSMFVRADAADLIVDMSGTPNQGDFSFNLNPDPDTNNPNDGWNLIGNPYASPITWDVNGWSSSGVNPVLYIRDNEAQNWRSYDSSLGLEIAAGQAFYVRVIDQNPSITISETAKSSNQPIFYRTAAPIDYLTISLNSEGLSDIAYILLREENVDEFENEFDGIKRQNSSFNLSTLSSDSVELAVNKVSTEFCTKSIRISIKDASPGIYKLEFSDFDSFKIPILATLVDKYTTTEFDLRNNNIYEFTISTDPASFGSDRFSLILNRPDVASLTGIEGEGSCGGTAPSVLLEGSESVASYQLYLDDLPVSEVFNGNDLNVISVKIDSSLLNYGTQKLILKGWYESCGNKRVLGEVNVDFYDPKPQISVENGMIVSNSSTGNQWLLNGEIIEGATEPTYIPLESGEYSVLLTEGICSAESLPITFIVTGIEESLSKKDFSLYPNPADGVINISIESNNYINSRIIIYNSKGKIVYKKVSANQEVVIPIQNYPKGLYLVKIIQGDNVVGGKFIKQ